MTGRSAIYRYVAKRGKELFKLGYRCGDLGVSDVVSADSKDDAGNVQSELRPSVGVEVADNQAEGEDESIGLSEEEEMFLVHLVGDVRGRRLADELRAFSILWRRGKE